MTLQTPTTPQFIVIGGQRCGTTWVHQALMEHPDIFVPRRRKGVAYSTDQSKPYSGQPVRGLVNSTLLQTADAPLRIRNTNANTQLIAVLRNPIDRAYSWYLKSIRDGSYPASIDFESALERDPSLVANGRYYLGIANYLDHFERDQVLILRYRQLSDDPFAFLRTLYSFVSADPAFVPQHASERINYAAANRSQALHRFLQSAKRSLWRISSENGPLVNRMETSRIITGIRRLNERPTQEMGAVTRRNLVRVFEQDNRHLEDLLGWDLSSWT